MEKLKEKVSQVMSPLPYTVSKDAFLTKAQELMRHHSVRHLPVLHAGQLVGILSERDVHFVASFSDFEKLKVEEAMTPEPFVVNSDTTIREVAQVMAQRRFGSVIIENNEGKVVGIFTATDALQLLSEL